MMRQLTNLFLMLIVFVVLMNQTACMKKQLAQCEKDAKAAATAHKKEATSLRSEVKNAKTNLEKSEMKLTTAKEDLSNSEKKLNKVNVDLAEANVNLDSTSKKLLVATNDLTSAKSELSNAQAELKTSEAEVVNLNAQKDSLKIANNNLELDRQEAEARFQGLSGDFEQAQGAYQQYNAIIRAKSAGDTMKYFDGVKSAEDFYRSEVKRLKESNDSKGNSNKADTSKGVSFDTKNLTSFLTERLGDDVKIDRSKRAVAMAFNPNTLFVNDSAVLIKGAYSVFELIAQKLKESPEAQIVLQITGKNKLVADKRRHIIAKSLVGRYGVAQANVKTGYVRAGSGNLKFIVSFPYTMDDRIAQLKKLPTSQPSPSGHDVLLEVYGNTFSNSSYTAQASTDIPTAEHDSNIVTSTTSS